MSVTWNPWHGCKKISPGCVHCYVYRIDSRHDKDSSVVKKTLSFNLPIKKKRNGDYKVVPGEEVYACFSSDFFVDEGYDNVSIGTTVENQDRADYRLPIFRNLPIKHKTIICEPLLEKIDFGEYLDDWVDGVVVGGESGSDARICDYKWVLDIRRQCMLKRVAFHFKQTGARFRKEGRLYLVNRKFQHSQARKAGIDFIP